MWVAVGVGVGLVVGVVVGDVVGVTVGEVVGVVVGDDVGVTVGVGDEDTCSLMVVLVVWPETTSTAPDLV